MILLVLLMTTITTTSIMIIMTMIIITTMIIMMILIIAIITQGHAGSHLGAPLRLQPASPERDTPPEEEGGWECILIANG